MPIIVNPTKPKILLSVTFFPIDKRIYQYIQHFIHIFPCTGYMFSIFSLVPVTHVSYVPSLIYPTFHSTLLSYFLNPRFQYTPANYDCQVFLTIFINMMKIIKIPFYLAIGFMVLTLSPILLIKSIFQ